jgi:hypothetical protein
MFPQALGHEEDLTRNRFGKVGEKLMPPDKQAVAGRVLEWHKARRPVWFSWLDIA